MKMIVFINHINVTNTNMMNLEELEKVEETIKTLGWDVLTNLCYKNIKIKCSKGHTFGMRVSRISSTSTCQKCDRMEIKKKFLNIIEEKGGSVDENAFTLPSSRMEFQCKRGHVLIKRPTDIVKGVWCGMCRRINGSEEKFNKILSEKNAICLDTYVNTKTKIRIRCENGHVWNPVPSNLFSGIWCRYCAPSVVNAEKHFLQIVNDKGGSCKEEYVNSRIKTPIFCERGHVFNMSPDHVKAGGWCKYCNDTKRHATIIKALVDLNISYETDYRDEVGKTFDFSINWENKHILIEYDCKRRFTSDSNLSTYQQNDLKQTKGILERKDTYLLRICYTLINHDINLNPIIHKAVDFSNFLVVLGDGIYDWLLSNIDFPYSVIDIEPFLKIEHDNIIREIKSFEIPKEDKKATDIDQEKLHKIRSKGEDKGWKLLTTKYENVKTKVTFQCENKHIFEILPKIMFRIAYCRECVDTIDSYCKKMLAHNIKMMNARINLRKYRGRNNDIEISCENKHTFDLTPDEVNNNRWCGECSKPDRYGRIFKSLIEYKGGVCIGEYKGGKTKVSIKCSKNHVWGTNLSTIKGGSWCPKCTERCPNQANELFLKAVEKREGVVLGKYVNSNTKVKVRCKEGHEWDVRPDTVKSGSWCRKCIVSKGEILVEKVLSGLGLEYEREFSFDGSRKSYDFLTRYKNKRIFIEWDGKQHFVAKSTFHRNVSEFSKYRKRDIEKTKLVLSMNDCRMIRISYRALIKSWNVKSLLEQALNSEENLILIDKELYDWLINVI